MKSAPYFALKPPSESTLTGPARLTSPCVHDHLDARMLDVGGRNTDMHSCSLSIAYFSVTFMVARISPDVRIDERDLAADLDAIGRPCVGGERDRNRPEQRRSPCCMPSQTPSQSAWVMKPSSGVKPPMPSMMRSPFSREDTRSCGSARARANSAFSAAPSSSKGLSEPPP